MSWVKQEAPNLNVILEQRGMTLRDYFAAKAMQGILVGIECDPATVPHVAESAYILADAMLKARQA
jgi:hypothetical protein